MERDGELSDELDERSDPEEPSDHEDAGNADKTVVDQLVRDRIEEVQEARQKKTDLQQQK
jgi:hypothetical protein